jgi:hypothetical protein
MIDERCGAESTMNMSFPPTRHQSPPTAGLRRPYHASAFSNERTSGIYRAFDRGAACRCVLYELPHITSISKRNWLDGLLCTLADPCCMVSPIARDYISQLRQ